MKSQKDPYEMSISHSASDTMFALCIHKQWMGEMQSAEMNKETNIFFLKDHILMSFLPYPNLVPLGNFISEKFSMSQVINTRSLKPLLLFLLKPKVQSVLGSRIFHLRNISQDPPFFPNLCNLVPSHLSKLDSPHQHMTLEL